MGVWRCDFTKNPCNTDTVMIGTACGCQPCCMARVIDGLRAEIKGLKTPTEATTYYGNDEPRVELAYQQSMTEPK